MGQMPMDVALRHALASVTKMFKTRPWLLAVNNSSIIFVLLRTDENIPSKQEFAQIERRERVKLWKGKNVEVLPTRVDKVDTRIRID